MVWQGGFFLEKNYSTTGFFFGGGALKAEKAVSVGWFIGCGTQNVWWLKEKSMDKMSNLL